MCSGAAVRATRGRTGARVVSKSLTMRTSYARGRSLRLISCTVNEVKPISRRILQGQLDCRHVSLWLARVVHIVL